MSEKMNLKQLSESLGKPEHVIEYWIKHKQIISAKKEKGRLVFTQNEAEKLKKHFTDRENNKASSKKRQANIVAMVIDGWKEKNKTINCQVIEKLQYDTHHVAKFDKDFKLIGFYRNRNQAVIDHFKKKGWETLPLLCDISGIIALCATLWNEEVHGLDIIMYMFPLKMIEHFFIITKTNMVVVHQFR
jgi:hypothetical protein